jgi:Glycoside Hydrolase Family 113
MLVWLIAAGQAAAAQRLDGFNVIAAPDHGFGTPSATQALVAAKQMGAVAVAIVPFLWQPDSVSPQLVRGNDMPDADLRAAIRDVHTLGLAAVVKPHVWVPGSWAGAIAPGSEPAWRTWFARYRAEIVRLAQVASEEGADAFAVGTELVKTTQRPEWSEIIAAARMVFARTLFYVAHNAEEAEAVPFWRDLDLIGVTLYPALGAAEDAAGRQAVMERVARRLDGVAARDHKPIVVAEIGLRSAKDATLKPWESPEERRAEPDPAIQAQVLREWLKVLDRPAVRGVLIWRMLSDPGAGGPADTDFTVQGKPAAEVLRCAWTLSCGRP